MTADPRASRTVVPRSAGRPSTPDFQRRRLLAGLGATACAAATAAGVPETAAPLAPPPLVLAQSVCLDGPLADLGLPMHLGAKAGFAALNAAGGIHGRRIELVAQDDGYEVTKAVANYKSFLADARVFALFGCMGTPMIEALLPMIRGTDVPCFAAFTGATSVRPTDMPQVLPVRASFGEEAQRLAQHLATIGYKRVGIVHVDNGYGREVALAAHSALEQRGRKPAVLVALEDMPGAEEGACQRLLAADPEVVLLGLAGKSLVAFVSALRARNAGVPLYSVSALATPRVLSTLKGLAHGITVSQVMPSPEDVRLQIVREFRQAWEASKAGQEPSYAAIEGYVSARCFAEVLRRAGPAPTRTAFVRAARSMTSFDLGGLHLGFDRVGRGASRLVELTLVRNGGRFMR